mmetsp:Transcript_123368/g.227255  ORF Transcript_123368/g.227255 Transcript_123368/m.227255 type:complete len:223 (-) Transcript_123368:329-997(-)
MHTHTHTHLNSFPSHTSSCQPQWRPCFGWPPLFLNSNRIPRMLLLLILILLVVFQYKLRILIFLPLVLLICHLIFKLLIILLICQLIALYFSHVQNTSDLLIVCLISLLLFFWLIFLYRMKFDISFLASLCALRQRPSFSFLGLLSQLCFQSCEALLCLLSAVVWNHAHQATLVDNLQPKVINYSANKALHLSVILQPRQKDVALLAERHMLVLGQSSCGGS